MKKIILGTLSLAVAMSLNAAVVATVNGEKVTDDDVAALMGGGLHAATLEQLPKETKQKIIEQAIDRKLMMKEAIKSGVEKDKDFKEALQSAKDNIALEVWMKKIYDGIKISDADMKKFYKENDAKFMKPAEAKAKHILVKTEKEANDIIKELSNLKGESLTKKFEEIAKAKSEDKGSGQNGGELGWFAQNQMVKPFSDAAFELKKGEMTTKPVKSQFGYHIILKEDSKPAEKVKFDEAKTQIESALKMDAFRDKVVEKSKELRKNAKIEYK